jgi:brefeldin A-resistance guanine nucleotide exchange factor 1
VQTPEFDQDLFLATWGPTVAALSSVFDHSEEKRVVQRATAGFSKCASVAARYELRDVFDNVIISLCKFSTLLNMPEVTIGNSGNLVTTGNG